MWKNSNFQIEHFILSDSHSAWEKYRVLEELRLDRMAALKTVRAAQFRQRAKIAAVKEARGRAKLEREADLTEMEASLEIVERDIKFAQQEYDFINQYINALRPELEATRIEGFSDEDMFQTVQQKEWLERLKARAKNEMICTGTLNPETLRVMMSHPQYKDELLPYLKGLREIIASDPLKLLE